MFRDPQINYYVRDVEASVGFYRGLFGFEESFRTPATGPPAHVEASVRFYSDLFGFEESFRTPATGPPAHVELCLGGLILGLASIESARDTHGLEVGVGQPRAEICLWTDDVDRVHTDLVAQDVESLSSPHNFLGRLRSAWVADPDGNPVQIVAEHEPGTTHE